MHAHGEPQLIVPIAGRMRLHAGSAEHLLGPEQVALVPAGLAHGFTYLDGALEFLAIDAPVGWAAAPGPVAAVAHAPGAWLMARALAAEVDRGERADRGLVAHVREALGIYVARALVAGAEPDPDDATRRVLAAVDRMLRDYAAPLRIEALAAEQAMSARHFERRFKATLGQSPRRFLIEVRLRAARDLLARTDWPIARIAAEVGFATPAHFADTFARAVGVAPGVWRARLTRPGGGGTVDLPWANRRTTPSR